MVEVPEETLGVFYSGDSYVVLYESRRIAQPYVYFWLGFEIAKRKKCRRSTSSNDEKASAAIFAAKLDNQDCRGAAVQVRVVQSKEPTHFAAIFGGFIVTLSGGKASGFKSVPFPTRRLQKPQ